MKIGTRIKHYRGTRSRPWLAKELANYTDAEGRPFSYTPESVRLWEIGKHGVPPEIRAALAQIFKVSEQELEFGASKSAPPATQAEPVRGVDPAVVLALAESIQRDLNALKVLCRPTTADERLHENNIRPVNHFTGAKK